MIKLIEGNALNVMGTMNAGSFDALITDPPYASGGAILTDRQRETRLKYTSGKGKCPHLDFEGDKMDQRTWTRFMADILENARRLCKKGGVCVVFSDWRQLPSLSEALQRGGWTWRGIIVWDKLSSRPQPGRYRQQSEFALWGSNGNLPTDRPVEPLPGVYRHANVQGRQRIHQTQKPLELMQELIRITVPGGHILDPFAGSGSTLAAAEAEGYHATGIEISHEIARLAAERLDMQNDGEVWHR